MALRIVALLVLQLSLPSRALALSEVLKKEAPWRSAPRLDADSEELDADLGSRVDADSEAELDADLGGRLGVTVDMDETLDSDSDATADLVAGAAVDVGADLDANADLDDEIDKDPIVNFLPDQRRKIHLKKFEKDLVVNMSLNMKKLAGGEVLGLKLNVDTDFEPVLVQKIKKKGMVQDFNDAHPEDALHVGDQIVQVNDIVWHHNSNTFVKRIKGQFTAARNSILKSPFLVLYAQRPRVQKNVRTYLQRDDLHYQAYAKDFTAKIRMPPWLVDNNMNKAMGWQLRHGQVYEPIVITKIKKRGILPRHNEENPAEQLLPGDEIVAVNGVNWHNNATEFLERLFKKFESTRRVPQGRNRTLSLDVRRPRKVQEEYDKVSPYEEVEANVTSKYTVELDMPKMLPNGTTQALLMGWQLKVGGEDTPPIVEKIRARGMIARHNAQHPDNAVKVGDRVTQVNGNVWRNNSEFFFGRIGKQLAKSIKHVDGDSEVTFIMERTELKTVTRKKKDKDEEEEEEEDKEDVAESSEVSVKRAELVDATAALNKVDLPAKAEAHRMAERLEGMTAAWNKLHPADRIDNIDWQVLADSLEKAGDSAGSPDKLLAAKPAAKPVPAAKKAEPAAQPPAKAQEEPKKKDDSDDDDDVIGAEG